MSGENEVDIDPQALGAELSAVQLPADPGAPVTAPGSEQPEAGPAGEPTLEQLRAAIPQWRMGSDFVVNALSDVVAPNWAITPAERSQLSDAISIALEAWFPGQWIPVRYQVLLGIAVAIWSVVNVRRQANSGKLPPLRLAAHKGAAATAQPAPPAPSSSAPASA